MNWINKKPDKDEFGKLLLQTRISKKMIKEWSRDPRVKLPDGSIGSLFDFLEDLDAQDCLHALEKVRSLR